MHGSDRFRNFDSKTVPSPPTTTTTTTCDANPIILTMSYHRYRSLLREAMCRSVLMQAVELKCDIPDTVQDAVRSLCDSELCVYTSTVIL